jgi:hypothetical protein
VPYHAYASVIAWSLKIKPSGHGYLCVGSDFRECARYHELETSNAIVQSPGLKWIEPEAVYFKGRFEWASGIVGV